MHKGRAREKTNVLPWRDDEDDAHGGAPDETAEARFVCVFESDIGERLLGDGQHVMGAVKSAANLARDLRYGPMSRFQLRRDSLGSRMLTCPFEESVPSGYHRASSQTLPM